MREIICLLVLIALVVVAWYAYDAKETYNDYPTAYATLDSIYSRPLFEPDMARRCADGAYMYSSNPWLGSYCSSVPPELTASVGCSRAYSGRPVRVPYTLMSNTCCPKPCCHKKVVASCDQECNSGCSSCSSNV